jgi:beta-lactamase class A
MVRRLVAFTATLMLAFGLTGAAWAAPAASVDTQFDWLIDASARLPVPDEEVTRHLDQNLLTAIGGPAGFNDALRPLAPFTAGETIWSSATELRRVVTGAAGPLLATLVVDSAGLLAGLRFTPYQPAPTSWAQVDAALRPLAPRVSFAAARISAAGCTLVHGADPATPRPLGSAFKLYVLGALAQAIGSGRFSWDTELAVNPDWKSLPSGVLQNEPDGTLLTLADYADYMIAISDNTAADHLIHEVGRSAVHQQFLRFGNHAANTPVLTTREFFALKGSHYPRAAAAYAALPPALRAVTLPRLDRVPLAAIAGWTAPRMIDKIEWFGSAMDLCQAYAGLWARHDPQVNAALTINDGGVGLSPATFPTVWFKGGSEPGVLTLSYLARSADGSLVTAILMLSDPKQPLAPAAAPQALAVLRGALTIAAG